MRFDPARVSRLIRTLLTIGWADRVALVEAMLLSVVAALVIRFVAFRRVAGWMGDAGAAPTDCEVVDNNPELVRRVRWAVDAVERRVPWPCNCFGQAVMARSMLGRRGVAGAIHFGLTKANGGLEGHAWVRADGRMVTGAIGLEEYATVSTFSFGSEPGKKAS